MNATFDFAKRITEEDREIASNIIGSLYRPPDLVISPTGHGEYLFRWHIVRSREHANVYFHIQTQSDPERPLHDHPWDSTSVILAGGYDEIIDTDPHGYEQGTRFHVMRKVGDVIHRPATWAHRLILPCQRTYSMSLFTTGPKVKDWGFFTRAGWVPFEDFTIETNGRSQWKDSVS